MLSRVCEPLADDPRYEAEVYREMDHGGANEAFVTDLLSRGPVGPRVIDLGCGPALIPIMLCEHAEQLAGNDSSSDPDGDAPDTGDDVPRQSFSELEVMGVDNCVEMLELARLEIEFAGRLRQIQLQQIDLNDAAALQPNLADTVICNTVLHHLDDPSTAVRLAIGTLRPGGRLFIRDLVRPETDADVERLVALHGGAAKQSDNGISPRQLLRQSLHASLTLTEIRDLVLKFGIDTTCVSMTSDRHWTLDYSLPALTIDASQK